MSRKAMSAVRCAVFCVGLLLGLCSPGGAAAETAPANDRFSDAILIDSTLTTNVVLSGSNIDATMDPGESFHAESPSGRSVWWTWTPSVNASVVISTEGSTFDTLLAVYTGSSVTSLVSVIFSDDDVGKKTSRVLFRAIGGETYRIAVDGFQGEAGDIVLNFGKAGTSSVPGWELSDVDGKLIRSTDYRNKVLLLDFWSITCAGCIEEMPGFVSLQTNLHALGFQVVGLYKTTMLYEVRSIVASQRINFPMAELTPEVEAKLAPLQTRSTPYILAYPTTYVIDREGRLVAQVADGGKDLAFFQKLIHPLMRMSTGVRLQTKWESGNLRLTWPGAENFDIIESTTNLTSGAWSQELVIFGHNSLTLPAGANGKFYRLRKPAPAGQ